MSIPNRRDGPPNRTTNGLDLTKDNFVNVPAWENILYFFGVSTIRDGILIRDETNRVILYIYQNKKIQVTFRSEDITRILRTIDTLLIFTRYNKIEIKKLNGFIDTLICVGVINFVKNLFGLI